MPDEDLVAEEDTRDEGEILGDGEIECDMRGDEDTDTDNEKMEEIDSSRELIDEGDIFEDAVMLNVTRIERDDNGVALTKGDIVDTYDSNADFDTLGEPLCVVKPEIEAVWDAATEFVAV